jgi:hypothetical protein
MQLIELSARFSIGFFLLLLRPITCLNAGADYGRFRGVIYDADAGHIRRGGEPLLHRD